MNRTAPSDVTPLFTSSLLADPHAGYAELRTQGPIQRTVTPDGAPVWLVTRYDDVRALLNDPRLSLNKATASSSGEHGASMPAELDAHLQNSDPPDHTRLRTLVSKAFTPRSIEALRPLVQRRVGDLVARLEGSDSADLIQEVVADAVTYSSDSSDFLQVESDGGVRLRSAAPEEMADLDIPGVLATADPPDHTRQRKELNRVFSTTAIARLEPEVHALVASMLEPHLTGGTLDWMTAVGEPLPAVVLARLLGLDDATAPFLRQFGYASVEQIGGFVSEERRQDIQRGLTDLGPVAAAYTEALAGNGPGGDTVLGACAEAVRAGQLTDLEAISILLVLVSAGSESTASLLGTGVRILAEDQALQQRLREHPELLPAFVEEACRIDPPFRGHYRRVAQPAELGGVALPAGARLVLVWPAANRDADLFDQPDQVDLDRRGARRHLGFGWGIHLCMGAPIARLEARVAFGQLLASTTSFELDKQEDPPVHQESLMIRRLLRLPLRIDVRQPR